MAKRRGFLAEMQHQNKLAEQRQRANEREQAAAARRAEQARKTEERALLAALRASEADRKRLEKEAAAAHIAAKQAEVEELNEELAATYERVDNLLSATLNVDDFVDLESLRQIVRHPKFDRADLEVATPKPAPINEPSPPEFQPPAAPTGLFGRKKKMAQAQAQAETDHAQDYAYWEHEMKQIPGLREQASLDHAKMEETRKRALTDARSRYDSACQKRLKQVNEHNVALDELITNLGYGVPEAIQEYVGIVLANSVYPEDFSIEHEETFDPSNAELKLRVLVPGPSTIPTIKSYKYVKANDEISPVQLSQKDAKDRYAGIVHQVALRTLHEIFEADRRGLIQTISLEVGTETINPATGLETYIPFVAVGAERETFAEFDLSAVTPALTLEHLGAAISKNPLALAPANVSGVRRS